MNAELEVQKALRARLIGNAELLAILPAAHVVDTGSRPSAMPSIIIGDGQAVDEGTSIKRTHLRIFHDLHVWMRESATEGVKRICGLIHDELRKGRLALPEGLHCADLIVSRRRHLRDPDGLHAHSVMTIEVLVSEVPR